MDPLLGQFKIDRARRIVGENHETGTVLNRPLGRSQEFLCGFHFGHHLKFITLSDSTARSQQALPTVLTSSGRLNPIWSRMSSARN
jgi:hypothetical protein